MSYKILRVNPCLYYIKWFEIPKPNNPVMDQYFFELTAILDSEENPVYILSDLRDGHITNIHFLLQLARVLTHKNYGGGATFDDNVNAQKDVYMFNMIQNMNRSKNPRDGVALFDNPEDALDHVELIQPTITQGVDWDEILRGAIFNT